ncbi:MAG: cytochrome b/b6 domain-containing protein [Mariprofundaceae bacterium]
MSNESVKVWDILIRVFHWSLAIFFLLAYVTGDELEIMHAYIGYIIIGLLGLRIIWGIIGTQYARFTNFIYSPKTIMSYLKSLLTSSPKHYLGHNPAGGAMVIVMILFLTLVSWSGLKAYEAEGKGPLVAMETSIISEAVADSWYEDDHRHGHKDDDFWEDIHEFTVNFMLLLILFHLGGILVSSALHKENLVRAMITGRKNAKK